MSQLQAAFLQKCSSLVGINNTKANRESIRWAVSSDKTEGICADRKKENSTSKLILTTCNDILLCNISKGSTPEQQIHTDLC